MKVTLTTAKIEALASARDASTSRTMMDKERALEARMPKAAQRGYLAREDLMAAAEWKWRGGRVIGLCAKNSEAEVERVSGAAFAAEKSERLRIGALLVLRGVQWSMASVILHFSFPSRYPILDKFAMAAVGSTTYYTFDRWERYSELCRKIAADRGVTLRTLDKALWQDGKKRSQPPADEATK